MSRRTDERIHDIQRSIERCRRFEGALDADDVELREMAMDAIERNLQIIGEAANHLPVEVTAARREISWPQIRGLRNILVHQYFGVDADTIRDVIRTHLPQLAASLSEDRVNEPEDP